MAAADPGAAEDELAFMSVSRAARAIRRRTVSSRELVEACLARIEAVNPWLNAVVVRDADAARRAAERADVALARGAPSGPLHGVPMTIKDSLDTAGMVTTYGLAERADTVPARDATAVARARAAGAILVGKTNTPPLTFSFETSNPVYGVTNNPYAIERSPGGSSGGSAAIVAAGGVPFDIGSDTGGSVRQPCHFCGVAGIRPTSGRVPRTGNAVPPGGLLDRLTQIGPIARSVEDLGLILSVLAGPDGRDPAIAPARLRAPASVEPRRLRAAFYTDNGVRAPAPAIADAVGAAAEALAAEGVAVEERRPPGVEEAYRLFIDLFNWDGGAWRRLLRARALSREVASSEPSARVPAADVVSLIDRWDRLERGMLEFVQAYDVLLAPVNASPALPHGTANERLEDFSYTMTYSLTGWPAAVVRAAATAEGLPVGVQVIARPWREDVALAAAGVIERRLGGWRAPEL
ncbi:MAG: amidase [Gammaproteobacteria bacterium]|nr:amidase [Gammaproteobacteria bacterium]